MNTTCDITCKTNDHSETIRFYKNGTILDSCIPFGYGTVRCSYHNRERFRLIPNEIKKETVLRIQQLNVLDIGVWHCSYGHITSEKKELIVYSKYIVFVLFWIINIYEPLHKKTYNFDWRHNLLKRCHKLGGGGILTCGMFMVHVYFLGLYFAYFSADCKYEGINRI